MTCRWPLVNQLFSISLGRSPGSSSVPEASPKHRLSAPLRFCSTEKPLEKPALSFGIRMADGSSSM